MASLRERTSRSGETTWSVLYRLNKVQTSTTFATEKAATDFKALVEILGPAKALEALARADQADGLTVSELAERFFEWKAHDVTPRTIADYRRDFRNWIEPHLGHRPAETVDETDVQALVDHMTKVLDPKSVADRHILLHGIYRFGAAKSRRLVTHNPCLETELPRRRKKPVRGVTLPEWRAIYDAACRVDPDAADLLLFIAGTGWRWSEATAITVGGIEVYADEHGVVHTFAIVRRVFRRDEASRTVVAEGEAKSEAGRRRVKLGEVTAGVVRRRLVGKGPAELIFTNRHGSRWHQTNFLHRNWPAILAEAGLPTEKGQRHTPHALRHTHVALLDRAGVSLPEIKRRLGHEDIQTTINTYGGMIDEISDDALVAVDRMLVGEVAGAGVVEGSVVAAEVVGELEA